MLNIATLGPQETFSDLATHQFIDSQSLPFKINYFGSLSETFKAIGTQCEYGVLPIENLSEGYVQVVLDHLFSTDLIVVAELLLDIQFAFVADCKEISELTDLYVQFVAHGQCSEFINQLSHVKIHNTGSNMESLLVAEKKGSGVGAIIPQHALDQVNSDFLIKTNVTNYENNQTRFLILTKQAQPRLADKAYKTTLVVKNDNDCPGVLGNIVNAFASQKVNLTSIMSRPTKSQFGKYHFFIDIDGHQLDENISVSLKQISAEYPVTVIGSYIKAN